MPYPWETETVPAPRAGQLTARRREALDDVLGAFGEKKRQVRVVLYAATEPGEDPGPDLAACRTYAASRGWEVSGWHFDDTGRHLALYERNGWKHVRAAISGGFVAGVVTINRHAVALDDDPYEHLLTWLTSYRAFLDFPTAPGVPE